MDLKITAWPDDTSMFWIRDSRTDKLWGELHNYENWSFVPTLL